MTNLPIIDAAPTKAFFIHMLIRDIELIPAIGDLVDNSVDGARRIRGDGPYGGLFVRLSLSATHFQIEDNCGGIPLEVAEKYAFRFGRPTGAVATPHSIGQFGVGMKRSLFKLGTAFGIRSSTNEDSFSMEVDVEDWQETDEWEFQFSEYQPNAGKAEAETVIEVTKLHQEAAAHFQQTIFLTRLANSIGSHHQRSIEQGLVITVNGMPVGGGPMELLASAQLKPAVHSLALYEDTPTPVQLRFYAGISAESLPSKAGWCVYCNGRLVLEADKTPITGWGVGDADRFPQFHNRYARFRGYTFFDCDDAGKLPWTTTKTGVNTDSAVYQRAVQLMRELGRPVTNFLYELSVEVNSPPEELGTELSGILEGAQSRQVKDLTSSSRFTYQRPIARPRPSVATQSIQYRKPTAEIERAKGLLGVSSASEVGQRTFDYFMKQESGD